MRAGEKAEQKGFAQVLWLDGVERKYVEEVGSMNVMFKISGTVVTPKLTGSVLPASRAEAASRFCSRGACRWEERLLSVQELEDAVRNGTLEEAFGCGTAAVVSPIGELSVDDVPYVVNGGKIGPITQRLYDELTGIQWGRRPDTFGWTEIVK